MHLNGRRFLSETSDSVPSMDEVSPIASDRKLENEANYMTLESVMEKDEPIMVADVMDT